MSRYILIIGLLFCSEILAHDLFETTANAEDLYDTFKLKYNRNFANEDDGQRFEIFKANLQRAQLHQSLDQGTAEYGITKFSHLTADEFKALFLNSQTLKDSPTNVPVVRSNPAPIPPEFDWISKGAVGLVVDQFKCAAGWAFSAIGNVEGQWFMKTNDLYRFSQQQLLDCDRFDHGCVEGHPLWAFEALTMMGGVMLDVDYPYENMISTCSVNASMFVGYVNGSIKLDSSENTIAAELVKRGPLSMCVNAEYLQFYRKGIIHPPSSHCSPADLNHAVLGVGYGKEGDIPYWHIKNSMGTDFGEAGYFRIYRGDGSCGINSMVTSATIE